MPRSLGQRMRNPLDIVNAKKKEYAVDTTLAIGDQGYRVISTGVDKVFTLPATVVGYHYRVENGLADGTSGVTISPNSSDLIAGVGVTAADDKDFVNTKATAKKGDYIELVGNGTTGWNIESMVGIWAKEA